MAWQLAAAAIKGGMSFLKGRSAAKKAKKLARQQAAQYRAIGRYNSAIVQLNTRIERMQIKEQGDRLSKQQRELKAQQRMSIRGRGGIMGGGDLLQVIESANEMQTDLFQIMRTSALAQLSGDVKSNQILFEAEMNAKAAIAQGQATAKAARMEGIMGAVSAGVGYMANAATPQPTAPTSFSSRFAQTFMGTNPYQGSPISSAFTSYQYFQPQPKFSYNASAGMGSQIPSYMRAN